jgi:hypothetical protein
MELSKRSRILSGALCSFWSAEDLKPPVTTTLMQPPLTHEIKSFRFPNVGLELHWIRLLVDHSHTSQLLCGAGTSGS